MIIRRITAIVLPCGAAFALARFAPHIASQYRSLIIISCIAYVCAQLLTLIDPDFSERFNIAAELMNLRKRS